MLYMPRHHDKLVPCRWTLPDDTGGQGQYEGGKDKLFHQSHVQLKVVVSVHTRLPCKSLPLSPYCALATLSMDAEWCRISALRVRTLASLAKLLAPRTATPDLFKYLSHARIIS